MNRIKNLWMALLVASVASGATACADLAAGSPLAHARPSVEALAETALEAVVAGDEATLATLMITREEYEGLVWPVLPDRHQMPFDFVWSITAPRSREARRSVMADYRGVPLELVRVDLGDESESYDAFTIHRRARMWVRRTDTGAQGVFPLMDAVVEMGGGWKFMNFRDDA